MNPSIKISIESPESPDSLKLLGELSEKLSEITGNSGRSSFDLSDVKVPRSLFVIARNLDNSAVGCGAIRPISSEIGEIKRMYSKEKGVGSVILNYLESKASELDYKELWLETRRINEYAVNFYLKRGYLEIPNYGKYKNRPEAICFAKIL